MKKSDIKVLIVDDDKHIREVLSRAVESAGYEAIAYSNGDDALTEIKIKSFQLAVIDCMLPKMNGIDLVKEIRDLGYKSTPVFLMSGVFKDRSFTMDAIKKTGALEFFPKPFDINKIIARINGEMSKFSSSAETHHMANFLSKVMVSSRQRKKALDEMDVVSGYDVPFVISILMDGESSGHLNLVSLSGDIFGIEFYKGNIVNVDSESSTEMLIKMLVEKGFLNNEDSRSLPASLLKGSVLSNLVESNFVSPHSIPKVKTEQMLLVLKSIVSSQKFQINFSPSRGKKAEHYLEPSLIIPLLHSVVDELLTLDWLQSFYELWMDHPISLGPKYTKSHQLNFLPIMSQVEGIIECFNGSYTLTELLSEKPYKESDLLKAIHLLAINRMLVFEEHKKLSQQSNDMERLKNILGKIKDKNPFEIFRFFGAGEAVSGSNIERVYKEVAKVHHPDKLPADSSSELKKLVTDIFSIVTDAHHVLTNPEKRQEYERMAEQKSAEKQMKAENVLDDAIKELKRGKASEAMVLLQVSNDIFPTPLTKLYMAWAQLKNENEKLTDSQLKQLKSELDVYPERRAVEFFHVCGLYHKYLGDMEQARVFFEKALGVQGGYIQARRELSSLDASGQNKGTISEMLTGDLSTVIGGFFKKKSS